MKRSNVPAKRALKKAGRQVLTEEAAFAEVLGMIQAARGHALAAVNTALVELYWQVGEYISRKLETATWGEGVVDALAQYIQRRQPNLRGFTRRNLFRMRQFFDAYRGQEKVSALLTQLPWIAWSQSSSRSSSLSRNISASSSSTWRPLIAT
jgi:hypothetical protein